MLIGEDQFQYFIRQKVNRERPNQYSIGPQLAWSPSLEYNRPESQEKISALNMGSLDTLRENVQNGKESIGKLYPQ
jgi:hypothetical protein